MVASAITKKIYFHIVVFEYFLTLSGKILFYYFYQGYYIMGRMCSFEVMTDA